MFNTICSFFSFPEVEKTDDKLAGKDDQQPVVTFIGKIQKLGSKCSKKEMEQADQVMQIHNAIEEVAYQAFAEKVKELNLTDDGISAEQSGEILCYIKKKAHVEMFKKDGYINQRTKLLDPSQVQKVIKSVGRIVHDRDTKLTDARYYSLSELLMGLDDHNTMVKEILIESWFKLDEFSDSTHNHLEGIKKNVNFYSEMESQLKFDLKEALSKRQKFWDRYFPGLRQATTSLDVDTSANFIEVMEVRNRFEGLKVEVDDKPSSKKVKRENKEKPLCIHRLTEVNLEEKLAAYLSNQNAIEFFEPRKIYNKVRCQELKAEPLIKNKSLTVREFFVRYFPDIFLEK